ncbi:MFS transporter [Nocardioides flavus (ex Wang et al. 2016)]|uniref:MFS transporter n=1 Tax=Nocardioides flavus (ex Wang et al. 2016) TaxID=2058780 RepID=A0ABQ3HG09_9ACTN|nr:MFS transporter [Nocardioides flavus (ex Wang et al. 2016)]GHE16191.1 MFS transporter [Nocardioides flavus (ex Wang et al. 2016)]
MSTTVEPRERILSPAYAATTVAMFALIAFVAFEAMAVTTVMPTVARDLGGLDLYALAFAAPLASGVVGMVAAGMWSDRTGPVVPLLASLALFSAGLLVCGLAPSMEVLLAGRVLQGLGGGALTVGLYVVVGLVFPAALRPAVFASFAAAWVLPALFGPGLAALVADVWSWRWVFLGTVGFVAVALLLLAPALRGLEPHAEGTATPSVRLGWAGLGAVAVLVLELAGSARGVAALGALAALTGVWVSLGRLLPPGSRTLRRGLPSVIATRGLLSSTFFCAEAYIVYVLQEHWGLSPGRAGIALTCVGLVWAGASQVQSRLGARVSHTRAMVIGTGVVLTGLTALAASVLAHDAGVQPSALLPAAAYVLAGAGMGFAYPRTGVAMLEASTDKDRGFNSSALTVADSLGAALALSVAGAAFAAAQRQGLDPFVTVFVLAAATAVLGVLAAVRTRSAEGQDASSRVG